MNMLELYRISRKECLVYTEDRDEHKMLKKYNRLFATYQKNGRVFGWQHRVNYADVKKMNVIEK